MTPEGSTHVDIAFTGTTSKFSRTASGNLAAVPPPRQTVFGRGPYGTSDGRRRRRPCWCGSTDRSAAARPRPPTTWPADCRAPPSATPNSSASACTACCRPRSRGDFQDLPAWRTGTVEMLDLLVRRHPGPVIVPMTVTESGYFTETVGRLRELGHDVRHFTLLADRDTVLRRLAEREPVHHLRRLAGRPAPARGESFAVRRLDDSLSRLADPAFATHLHTDRLTVTQAADRIAHLAGLHPAPDTDTALRATLRRAAVKIRHLRLD